MPSVSHSRGALFAVVLFALLFAGISGAIVPADAPVVAEEEASSKYLQQSWEAMAGPPPTPVLTEKGKVELAGPGLFYILVEPSIYPEISGHIDRYMADVTADGYTPELHTEGWTDHFEVKALMQSGYALGMVGALFVGDIPEVRYEFAHDFWEYGYDNFPMELYYMDLDGLWIDADPVNGIYDEHLDGTGDVEPEIWVARLYSSTVTIGDGDEISLLKNYFDKNHEYRMGNMTLANRGLAYVDNDWSSWPEYYVDPVGIRYDNLTGMTETGETIAPDYKMRLDDYELASASAVNETVYVTVNGETEFNLGYADIQYCELWVDEVPGSSSPFDWWQMTETVDYLLDYNTGDVTMLYSWWADGMHVQGWLDASAYKSNSISDITCAVANETVAGPMTDGQTDFDVGYTNLVDLTLWVDDDEDVPTQWDWYPLTEGVDYTVNMATGEVTMLWGFYETPNGPYIHAWLNYSESFYPVGYDWISVFVHSSPVAHYFYDAIDNYEILTNTEVSTNDPVGHFFNLFCCSAADYTHAAGNGNLAGHYIFSNTHGICAIGSTKTGSMLEFDDFYAPLATGASIGDAFLNWFILNGESGGGNQSESRMWFYGMMIAGDPTLDTFDLVKPEAPASAGGMIAGSDVLLTWEKSPTPDVSHYLIYRSTDPYSFDFSTPWHNTSNDPNPIACQWADPGAGSTPQTYYYIIRAGDNGFNYDENTDVIMKYHHILATGEEWDLISIPFDLHSTSVVDVLSGVSWDYVVWYDAGDPDNHWKSYDPARPESLNDLMDVDNTMGIWLNTPASDEITWIGQLPVSTLIELKTGWNLVSYPSMTERTVADVLAGVPYTAVECYDPAQTYMTCPMAPTDTMYPGEGYWIKVSSDCVWNVDW